MTKARIIYLLGIIRQSLIERYEADGFRNFQQIELDIGLCRLSSSGYPCRLSDLELSRLTKAALYDILAKAVMAGI